MSVSRSLPLLFALAVAGPGPLAAQLPSFEDLTGRPLGQRITQHHEMARYLQVLAQASPRVRVADQGESWEGRRLLLAIVTAPENQARLPEIRDAAARLGDPRKTTPEEAEALIRSQPVIVWLGGSIHGFELSGSEGLLKLLEHLATRDDAETLKVLQEAVILIDPMLNPDGRDAFAQANHQRLGREPNPRRQDWGNDFVSWEALFFRTGHYFFDTNRDWFAHTQRETRHRVPTLQAWRPQVVVDAHEMSSDVEFYFDPPTEPYGPYFPDFARRWFPVFGEAYARAFDRAGFEYMTRERYNYFYPGYTTSYGSYQGAVGMLFEQGSSRGLAITRPDESVRRLGDALEQQYVAAWTAVATAVAHRETLLREFYQAHRAAVEEGRRGIRRYLLPPEGDPALVAELVNLLRRNGVEVEVLQEGADLEGVRDRQGRSLGRRRFPPGTYVVEAAQPRNRLIRALLEPQAPVAEEFLREARARVERGEDPRFYDITAWSLPLLFNLGGYGSTDGRPLPVQPVTGEVQGRGELAAETPGYAYVLDGRHAGVVATLYHLLDQGFRAGMILRGSRIGDLEIPGGSVIVRVGQNPAAVHEAVRSLARRYRLEVRGAETGLPAPGFPALGSGDWVVPGQKAAIAILAEQPVHAYSFGWAWYTLDRQYEIPTTVLRVRSVASSPLDPFHVLVIPDLVSVDELAQVLGEAGTERLKGWVKDGGTLVALGAAVEFVRTHLELTSLRSWYDEPKTDGKREGERKPEPQRFPVPGAILRARLDPQSWLAAGYGEELPVLVNSSRIYLAPEGPPDPHRRVVARYASADSLVLSGHLWPESRERLPGAVFAYEERIGRGRVIAFAEDPNFRAYFRGANRLFLNAVVLGPGAP